MSERSFSATFADVERLAIDPRPEPPLACPSCGGENDADCLRCAHCAAPIGDALQRAPIDPETPVPEAVRQRWEEEARQTEARLQATVERRVVRVKRRAAAGAGGFFLAALLMLAGAQPTWPAWVVFLLLDPVLGAAGVVIHAQRRGGPAEGAALLGLPLAVTSFVKVALGVATHGVTGNVFATLALLLGFTGLGITGGYLLGMRVHDEVVAES